MCRRYHLSGNGDHRNFDRIPENRVRTWHHSMLVSSFAIGALWAKTAPPVASVRFINETLTVYRKRYQGHHGANQQEEISGPTANYIDPTSFGMEVQALAHLCFEAGLIALLAIKNTLLRNPVIDNGQNDNDHQQNHGQC